MSWLRRLLAWAGIHPPAPPEDDPHLRELERRMAALDVEIAVQSRREREWERRRHAAR